MLSEKNELVKSIWGKISRARKILLHLHVNTDGDSVGSTLAMKKALVNMGVEVDLITGDNKEVPEYLGFLPGSSKILIKKFSEIAFADYDWFVALDSSNPSQVSREEGFEIPDSKTIIIDHHKGNNSWGDINLVDSDYVAVCELLVDFFEINSVAVDKEMAECMYVGISTDSGNFVHAPTNYKTLAKGARLAEISPKAIDGARRILTNIPKKDFLATNIAMQRLSFVMGEKVAISCITAQLLKENGCFALDWGPQSVASVLAKVEGVEAGICLYEDDGVTRISFRSKNTQNFNVRLLAEKFSIGGGHDAASGATYNGKIEEAREFLLEKIKEVFGN